MSVLPIVTYNDPVLRKKARAVEHDSDEIQELITSMFRTMYNASGVGLAAPQIGELVRIFVADTGGITSDEGVEVESGPVTFINPEISWESDEEIRLEEGCLSIPEVRDQVSRPASITVHYYNREFEKQVLTADGWLARVIQHELDHLDGILFLDHLSAFRRRLHGSRLRDIDLGKMETDYPVAPKSEIKS